MTGICKACRNEHKATQGGPAAGIEQSTTVIHIPEYQLAPTAQPSTSYNEPSSPIEVSVLYFYDSSRIMSSVVNKNRFGTNKESSMRCNYIRMIMEFCFS